jgi:hypothetical protein
LINKLSKNNTNEKKEGQNIIKKVNRINIEITQDELFNIAKEKLIENKTKEFRKEMLIMISRAEIEKLKKENIAIKFRIKKKKELIQNLISISSSKDSTEDFIKKELENLSLRFLTIMQDNFLEGLDKNQESIESSNKILFIQKAVKQILDNTNTDKRKKIFLK